MPGQLVSKLNKAKFLESLKEYDRAVRVSKLNKAKHLESLKE